MIRGVTHSADGTPIQRLTVAYKVSIGIPAGDGKSYPSKSDHFHIRAKNAAGEWVDDKEFSEKMRSIYMGDTTDRDGKKIPIPLREFDIIFLSDDIDTVFRTELAWWAATEKKCSGDGLNAMRSFTALSKEKQEEHKGERYIEWEPCGDACPDLDAGRCKPSGQLFFIFKDKPVMGSVAAYSTTSYESIKRIQSSLMQIQSVTGGRLRGIPLKIVMRPGKTTYVQDGKRKSGSAFFVNIEFRESDFRQLIPRLMEHSVQYVKSLTDGRRMIAENVEAEDTVIDVAEHETTAAAAMTNEFYPDNREPAVDVHRTHVPKDKENEIDIVIATCNRLGLNPAHREMLAQSLKGDISEMETWIVAFATGVEKLNFTPGQTLDLFTRAVIVPAHLAEVLAKAAEPKTEQRQRGRKKNPDNAGDPSAPPAAEATEPAAVSTPPAADAPKPTVAPTQSDLGSFEF